MIETTEAEREQLVALLDAVAQGDGRALARLYDLTSPILYGLLLRMLHRPEWAQEALQDSYLRVWQRAETFSAAKGEPIAWLIGIARYRALDILRARRPEPTLSEIGVVPSDLANVLEPGPEDRAVEREGLQRLLRCLRGLSEVQRKSVLLAYYEGYSHTELATAMHAPLGTVKAWIRRGLAHLRECLDR